MILSQGFVNMPTLFHGAVQKEIHHLDIPPTLPWPPDWWQYVNSVGKHERASMMDALVRNIHIGG